MTAGVFDDLFEHSIHSNLCTVASDAQKKKVVFADASEIGEDAAAALGLAPTAEELALSNQPAPASWTATSADAEEGGKTGVVRWNRQVRWGTRRYTSAALAETAARRHATHSADMYLNVVAHTPTDEQAILDNDGSHHDVAMSTKPRPVTFVFNKAKKQMYVQFGVKAYHRTANAPKYWLEQV